MKSSHIGYSQQQHEGEEEEEKLPPHPYKPAQFVSCWGRSSQVVIQIKSIQIKSIFICMALFIQKSRSKCLTEIKNNRKKETVNKIKRRTQPSQPHLRCMSRHVMLGVNLSHITKDTLIMPGIDIVIVYIISCSAVRIQILHRWDEMHITCLTVTVSRNCQDRSKFSLKMLTLLRLRERPFLSLRLCCEFASHSFLKINWWFI